MSVIDDFAAKLSTTQLREAFWSGVSAAGRGASRQACPYRQTTTRRGRPTWKNGYRNAWLAGWRLGGGRDREPGLPMGGAS